MNAREATALERGIEAVQEQVRQLTASVERARQEPSEQVKARIARIKADMAARHKSPDDTEQAGDAPRSQGQQFRADATTRMRGIHDSMERKHDEHDINRAEEHAAGYEHDALLALGFASSAIEHAEIVVLDAMDARTWADSLASASQTG